MFLASHLRRIRSIAFAMNCPPDVIDDIVQQTLLAGWSSRHTLRDLESLEAWLSTIARRTVLDWRGERIRRLDRDTLYDEPATREDFTSVDEVDRNDEVDYVLGHCRIDEKPVMLLRFGTGLTWKQIGEALEIKPARAKYLFKRARGRIRSIRKSK